jgi:hypothetical protein
MNTFEIISQGFLNEGSHDMTESSKLALVYFSAEQGPKYFEDMKFSHYRAYYTLEV